MQPTSHRADGVPAPLQVALKQVSKRFGQTAALSDVSLQGVGGSIHAITGENGAGKSTLMKLLAGVYRPDSGSLSLNGRDLHLASPAQARAAGISTVFQELALAPNLSAAESLALGREPTRYGLLKRRAMHDAAAAVLSQVGLQLDSHRLCGSLSIAEQQLLEIAKGIAADAHIFIFDEPTAALNRAETDRLEQLIKALAAQGKLIFYISHRLEEIFRFCDTVTILKDGQLVCTKPITELTRDSLINLTVGRQIQSLFPPRSNTVAVTPALEVRQLQLYPDKPAVRFTLRRGEIVGIAGMEGQGQRELMRTLAGEHRSVHKDVWHSSTPGSASPLAQDGSSQATVRRGLALIPEDRKGEGLYLSMPVQDNLMLGLLRRLGLTRRAPRDTALLQQLMQRMQLRGAAGVAVGALSGGNQQKVMLGRWLASGADTLLIEQPTRGVDVGAKYEIYQLLREYVAQGGAVLTVSGDLLELIGLCDRILVMRQGEIVAQIDAADATEEKLIALALQDLPATSSPIAEEALN